MNPVWALIIANTIWGAAAPIFKYALTDIPPFTFLFIRFFVASFIFFPFIKDFSLKTITKKDWLEIFLGSILGFTVHIGLLFIALEKTQSINASIVAIGTPILLFFFSIVFLHERMRLKVLSGILVSTIGILVIVFAPFLLSKNISLDVGPLEGNLLYIGSTIANVLGILLFKRVSGKVSPYVLTFLAFVIATASFFPFAVVEMLTWDPSTFGVPGIIGVLYGIFFSSALAYYLHFYGLSKTDGEDVAVYGYLNPILTVVVAIPLLKEIPNLYFMIGSVFVFIGMLVSETKLHAHPFHHPRSKT